MVVSTSLWRPSSSVLGGGHTRNDRPEGLQVQPTGWQRAIRIWAARTSCLFPSSGLMATGKEVLMGNGECGRGCRRFPSLSSLLAMWELARVPQPPAFPGGLAASPSPLATGQGP